MPAIIPKTDYTITIKDGAVKPLFLVFNTRARIVKNLITELKMTEGLPNGIYKIEIEWRLIKGVRWIITRIL